MRYLLCVSQNRKISVFKEEIRHQQTESQRTKAPLPTDTE